MQAIKVERKLSKGLICDTNRG